MNRRPVTFALASGLLLGLGVAVLLQQFAVRALGLATLVGSPLVAGIVGASAVLLARRAGRRS